jgi:hypothetical protein
MMRGAVGAVLGGALLDRDCRVATLLTRKGCVGPPRKTAEILALSSKAGRPAAGTELAMTAGGYSMARRSTGMRGAHGLSGVVARYDR